MSLPVELLPGWLGLMAWLCWAGLLAWTMLAAPWRALKHNGLVWLFNLSIALLAGLWSLHTEVHAGLGFHLLGLTSAVLVLGWRLALLAGAAALLLLALLGLRDFAALGLDGLVGVAWPVAVAQALHLLIYRWLPRHFFVYLLVTGFFSSMLVIAAVALLAGLIMLAAGIHDWQRISAEYLLFLPLLMFPEGFLNGGTMTMLAVFKPHWVRNFDDRDYIDGK